ncbi:alpha/beta hydrolase, partial [Litoreibacter sp.]|nr:alpha/beta hydrolase [Litoreibacter sp.]
SGQFITVDGTDVHYQIVGRGPDLVLIHGAGGSLRDFTFSMVDQLKDDFRVILFDRPGHGYTDRISGRNALGETPREQADLLASAAKRLGINDAVILGHSFGGAVAMSWILDHPAQARALVMIAGVSNEWQGDLGTWYKVTNSWAGRNILIPTLSSLASRKRLETTAVGIFEPNKVPDGYLDHMGVALSKSHITLQSTTQQVNGLKPQIIQMQKRYGAIAIPIEIIHGDLDTTVPLDVHGRVLARQVKGANLTVLKGVGHMPHHVAEPQVVSAIKRAAKRAGLR